MIILHFLPRNKMLRAFISYTRYSINMARIPDIGFGHISIKALKEKWDKNQILINEEYQRSEMWKPYQKRDLIDSIVKGFSIGTLVVWKNRENKLEILDGQQRIKTILRFLDNEFRSNFNKKYSELSTTVQSEIEGYSIYYLRLKSDLGEDQVSDIFTRLQEGTPLNVAEKVNAFRGKFRKTFIKSFFDNNTFFGRMRNFRFRARFLAAQFLLLELETNFEKKIFPGMSHLNFKRINAKYKPQIPSKKINFYNNNIKFLGTFLYNEVRAIPFRDWITFYLLASFLRKKQANQIGLGIYFHEFVLEFMKNLTSFSIYESTPPKGMSKKLFKKYLAYKQFGRKATVADSIEKRFKIVSSEYKKMFPKIKYKDTIKLFNDEQKVIVYFKQNGLCAICENPLDFSKSEAHHKYERGRGGPTKIYNAQIVHHKCHVKFHKSRR